MLQILRVRGEIQIPDSTKPTEAALWRDAFVANRVEMRFHIWYGR